MKLVLRSTNAAEAHVAAAALENAGIQAVIQGEYMGALPVGPASLPSLWVQDEDYAEACEILGVAVAQPGTEDRTSPLRPLVWIVIALLFGIILVRIFGS